MDFFANKTKIICTVGPASDSHEVLEQMIQTGMNVVRLNFSHGDFTSHKEKIEKIRAASQATGQRVAIMADLPGPKMRIGNLDPEPIELKPGDSFTLTTEDIVGNQDRVSVSFSSLPQRVTSGDRLFLNDGFIQIEVVSVQGSDVHCKIAAAVERQRPGHQLRETLTHVGEDGSIRMEDLIALNVENTLRHITPAVVVVPTRSGATARSVARYTLPVWITAVSSEESTCQNLTFSYGVFPVHSSHPSHPPRNWKPIIKDKLRSEGSEDKLVLLTEGPSRNYPDRNNRMEILDLSRAYSWGSRRSL